MAALARIVCVLALAVAGCDYFRPTEPEPPSGAVLRTDYTHFDSTLRTMARGIADKSSLGSAAYLDGLHESFRQIWWPEDSTESSAGPWSPWLLPYERDLYTYLIGLRGGESYALVWGPGLTSDVDSPTGAQVHRRYRLFTYTPVDTSIIAMGYADLSFVVDAQGRWVIVRWVDERDGDADPGDLDQVTLGVRRVRSRSGF
jgi:hypothetical protein